MSFPKRNKKFMSVHFGVRDFHRLTQKAERIFGPTLINRFTKSIITRYSSGIRLRHPAALILRHRQSVIAVMQANRNRWIHIGPRLTLTLILPQQVLSMLKIFPSDQAASIAPQNRFVSPDEEYFGVVPISRTLLSSVRTESSVAITQRLILGRTELAASAPLPLVRKGVRQESSPSHPVPRILHRSSIPQHYVEEALPLPQRLHTTPMSALPIQEQRLGNTQGVNVKELTEQVIEAIDRKIIAQRERIGRL